MPNAFFTNTSRCPRDLTSLVARVHSPSQQDFSAHSEGLEPITASPAIKNEDLPGDKTGWQPPSLDFRPLSFVNCSQSNSERPTSADGTPSAISAEIVSPTPERPISSQSRRRFSKILGIGNGNLEETSSLLRSYNSLNFRKLNKVMEVPERSHPARFSIPLYLPGKSTIEEEADKGRSSLEARNEEVRSSQITSHEQSTVGSLLDKHIECLGLQLEALDMPKNDSRSDSQSAPGVADETESTMKLTKLLESVDTQPPFYTSFKSSAFPPSLESPERKLLVPRKLFSNRLYHAMQPSTSSLASAQFLPRIPGAASSDDVAERPSTRWQTVASTAQAFSPSHAPVMQEAFAIDATYPETAITNRKESQIHCVPSFQTSGCSQSHDAVNLYDWSDQEPPTKCNEPDFPLKSWNRKMRFAHSLRHSSVGHRKSSNIGMPTLQQSLYAAPPGHSVDEDGRQSRCGCDLPQEMPKELLYMDNSPSPSQLLVPTASPGQKVDSTPEIPHRWSSVVAIAPEVVQPSMEIRRKTFVRTARSHRSITSACEPGNSTKLSAIPSPQRFNVPCLAAPDLGPPLLSLHIDHGTRYQSNEASKTPVLRETRSFFSDDSSGNHYQRGSIRKMFNLNSLRGVLPSSPRKTLASQGQDQIPSVRPSKMHNSCQVEGMPSVDPSGDMNRTGGMAEFAYRKRKLLERLKDWWKRHSMQRKLGLKGKRSSRSIPRGILV